MNIPDIPYDAIDFYMKASERIANNSLKYYYCKGADGMVGRGSVYEKPNEKDRWEVTLGIDATSRHPSINDHRGRIDACSSCCLL